LDVGITVNVVDAALGQLTSRGGIRIQSGGKAFDDDVAIGDHAV